MAYNETLAQRVRNYFEPFSSQTEEKRMMGGLTFMLHDKMCVGVLKEDLMCRIDPAIYDTALKRKGCREMDFTKRLMKGFVFVGPEGTRSEKDLSYWIELSIEYNKKAPSSKKKKAKK